MTLIKDVQARIPAVVLDEAFASWQNSRKVPTAGRVYDKISSLSMSDISGVVPINKGGSGQTTANAALNAFLPSQTSNSGKYLTTNGSNSSWDVVNGLSLGNTIGNSPTTGSVLFVGALGVLAQDNSNLFFDDTNNRLGIGINSSLAAKLHAKASSGSEIAGIFQAGAASPSVNVSEWRKSNAVPLASIFEDSNGWGGLRIYAGNAPVHGVDIRTDTNDTAYFHAAGTTNLCQFIIKSMGGHTLYQAFDVTNYHAPELRANFNGAIHLKAGAGVSGGEKVIFDIPANFNDGKNLVFGTSTGSKFGTSGLQKLGWWNATPVIQGAAIADITDSTGGTIGSSVLVSPGIESIDLGSLNDSLATITARINAILNRMRTPGWIAT